MIMKLLIMKVSMKYNFEHNACIFTTHAGMSSNELADSEDNNTALKILMTFIALVIIQKIILTKDQIMVRDFDYYASFCTCVHTKQFMLF